MNVSFGQVEASDSKWPTLSKSTTAATGTTDKQANIHHGSFHGAGCFTLSALHVLVPAR